MSDRDEIESEEIGRVVDDVPSTLLVASKSTSTREWVGVVANANSGLGTSRKRVERLASALRQQGLSAQIAWSVEERAELARKSRRDRDCRCLVAVGGDGTVSDVINERPNAPIAVLPTGTENLFARHFGFGQSPETLAETIARGRTSRIDLGLAGSRRFSLMAGLGFDADIVSRHHSARVSRGGKPRPTHRVAYVEPVLRAGWSYRFPRLNVRILDVGREETLEGTMVFLFNLPCYALGLPFAPSARADDGMLDLVVFRDPGALQALHYLWLVFRGIHLRKPGVSHRRVRKVSIETTETVPVQLDGDPGGFVRDSPWIAEIDPNAVEVLVPEGFLIPRVEII